MKSKIKLNIMKKIYILLLFHIVLNLQGQTMTFDSGASESGFTFSGWDGSEGVIFKNNLNSPSTITKNSGTWNLTSFEVTPFLLVSPVGNSMRISSNNGDTYDYSTFYPATHTLNWTNISSITVERIEGIGPAANYDNFVYNTCTSDSGLIVNGSAESGIVGWTMESGANWATRSADPVSQDCDRYFYAGAGVNGTPSSVTLSQVIDVSSYATSIDSESQYFNFSGYVRSYSNPDDDTSQIVIEYRNSDGNTLSTFDSDPIINKTAWQQVTDSRAAPANTRTIKIKLISSKVASGTNIDGYFDNLSLTTLSCSEPTALTATNITATSADLS